MQSPPMQPLEVKDLMDQPAESSKPDPSVPKAKKDVRYNRVLNSSFSPSTHEALVLRNLLRAIFGICMIMIRTTLKRL
jgi:hypothetical protein